MKSMIHQVTLASLFAVISGVGVAAQDEPAAEPAQPAPAVESPPPVVESPPPVVESPPPVVESPPPAVESVPQPVVESPQPQPVETAPAPAPVSTPAEPVESPRSGRPGPSPSTEGGQRDERPARGESLLDAVIGGNRDTSPQERTAPSPGSVAQSGRSGSGRGPDRPSQGGQPQRNDGGRSQLGISIGPGGVQVFRGNPGGIGPGGIGPGGIGPGHSRQQQNYYGGDRGRGSGSLYSPQWYQSRGWGIAIDTRPQVFVPSNPVYVTQPQAVQPAAPLPPEEPPVPTQEELSGMPGIELRGLLLYAVDRLDEQLNGLSTGSGWKSFLKIDELRRAVPPPTLAPPPPESGAETLTEDEPLMSESVRRQLADVLKKFDSVKQNPDYRQISQLWGFQTTHVVLRELLVPPIQRLRKQLTLSVDFLEQELQQFETSSSWAKHLKLDDAKRIAAVRTEDISAADRKQLQSIVSNFDSVAAKPSYRMISDLLGFRLAQHGARSYLAQLKVPAPPAPPSRP